MGGEDGVHSVTLDSGETESEAIMPKHFQDEPLMTWIKYSLRLPNSLLHITLF